MTTENLKQTLIELHVALAQAGPLDPELVHLLKVLDSDIQSRLVTQAATPAAVLRHDDPAQPANGLQDDGLGTRAQALSARFAAEHPHLEPVLRELTETLQRIGI